MTTPTPETGVPEPGQYAEVQTTDALLERLSRRVPRPGDLDDPVFAALSDLTVHVDEDESDSAAAVTRMLELLHLDAGPDTAEAEDAEPVAAEDAVPATVPTPRVIDLTEQVAAEQVESEQVAAERVESEQAEDEQAESEQAEDDEQAEDEQPAADTEVEQTPAEIAASDEPVESLKSDEPDEPADEPADAEHETEPIAARDTDHADAERAEPASDTTGWTDDVVTPMRPSRLGRLPHVPTPRHAPRFTGEERWERTLRQLSMPVAAAIAVFALGSGVTAALTGDPMKPLDSVGRVVDHLSGEDETVSYNALKENIQKAKVALANGDEATARKLLATVERSLDDVNGTEATLLEQQIAAVEEEIPPTGGTGTEPEPAGPSEEIPSVVPTEPQTGPTTPPSSEPTTDPSPTNEPTDEPSATTTTTPPPTTPDTEPSPLNTGDAP